jgi:hypothetical protein
MLSRALSHDTVLEENGRGGKIIVSPGIDLQLGRDKVLSPEFVADPELEQRLIQQAKAAARLVPSQSEVFFELYETDGAVWNNPTKSDERHLNAHHYRGAELGS